MKYTSLDHVLTAKGIPHENWPLIRSITEYIGILDCELTSSYIKARRLDVGPDLHIYYGYTSGFVSEQEAANAAGDFDRWQSTARSGLWGVTHPDNKIREGGTSSRARHEPAVCPNCYLTVPSNGVCDTCGWDQSDQA
ncbi:hypothetical protein H7F30_14075 [Dermacoccus sp. PAMC28757]|uniref:hypothetical protein n=1 Tax=Dermacoccus sp. PAMC28757 TaxID=2762331 RepID=UPI00164ED6C3|nr:hypothetical protein [Dermacoccus sp. PAMC28757]QNK52669.1 hypothetical protein H7F30_14075 [Dermacoccus sp. PAMC28757]